MAAFIREQDQDQDHDQLELQKPSNKHFCKICKKGFGCGRALGGHMRAHGIAADDDDDDDDPSTSLDWDNLEQTNHDHNKSNIVDPNRRMYALRTNPNRLKTCRICHNCGKEFFSWKSFLEHGKCTTSDDSDNLDSEDEDHFSATANNNNNNNNNNWSKRKRSLRLKVGSPGYSNEDEDLANCLMMLSNGVVERMFQAHEEESSNSATKDDHHHHHHHNTITKPINFIPPLSYRLPHHHHHHQDMIKPKAAAATAPKGMFECKACKKVFNSHQALGGHRASHKKVKGCFAARLDHMNLDPRDHNDDVFHDQDSFFPTKVPNNNNNNNNNSSSVFQYENGLGGSSNMGASSSKRKAKVHECSICHRIFSSGQALGGHKRCHWITSNNNNNTNNNNNNNNNNGVAVAVAMAPPPKMVQLPLDLKLDLNLLAPADEVVRAPPPFEVSTEIYLQSWISKNDKHLNHKLDTNGNRVMMIKNEEQDQNSCTKNKNNNNNTNTNTNTNNNNNNNNVLDQEDEGDSKVKLAKLSELKDMNMSGGNSSPWLQVGIGSTTHPSS